MWLQSLAKYPVAACGWALGWTLIAFHSCYQDAGQIILLRAVPSDVLRMPFICNLHRSAATATTHGKVILFALIWFFYILFDPVCDLRMLTLCFNHMIHMIHICPQCLCQGLLQGLQVRLQKHHTRIDATPQMFQAPGWHIVTANATTLVIINH